MANQTEEPSPKTSTTQAQIESLAAFLSDWSGESIQAPMMAEEEKTETEHRQIHPDRLSSSPSSHRPAVPPPGLPSGTLRRRSSNWSIAADEGEDGINGDAGNGGDGAMGSFATNSLPPSPPPLPFTLHEQHHNDQNGPLQHHETTSNVSPSCARTELHRHRDPSASARASWAGAGGIGIPPPPLSVTSRPSDQQNRVDTEAVEAPSISTSTSNQQNDDNTSALLGTE